MSAHSRPSAPNGLIPPMPASKQIRLLLRNIITRLVLYYAGVFLAAWGVWSLLSESVRQQVSLVLEPVMGASSTSASQVLAPLTRAK